MFLCCFRVEHTSSHCNGSSTELIAKEDRQDPNDNADNPTGKDTDRTQQRGTFASQTRSASQRWVWKRQGESLNLPTSLKAVAKCSFCLGSGTTVQGASGIQGDPKAASPGPTGIFLLRESRVLQESQ